MRVYFIKRKSDGMFLRAMEGFYSAHTKQDKTAWSETPAYMLRTPDGVRANIVKLCSTPYRVGLARLEWRDFDERKVTDFEVMVADISINHSETVPADNFLPLAADAE